MQQSNKPGQSGMKNITVAALALITLLTGCATAPRGAAYRPMIDSANIDGIKYESDLYDCQQYARQVLGAQDRAVAGAIFGALLGAAIGHNTGYANQFAAWGALGGAAEGANQGNQSQESIIGRCLNGRGYSVLQ